MYGWIGVFTAHDGKRDELIANLLEGSAKLASGCLNFIVSRDPTDDALVWVSEVWTDEASHDAAHSAPELDEARIKIKDLIASITPVATIDPVGGVGLPRQVPS